MGPRSVTRRGWMQRAGSRFGNSDRTLVVAAMRQSRVGNSSGFFVAISSVHSTAMVQADMSLKEGCFNGGCATKAPEKRNKPQDEFMLDRRTGLKASDDGPFKDPIEFCILNTGYDGVCSKPIPPGVLTRSAPFWSGFVWSVFRVRIDYPEHCEPPYQVFAKVGLATFPCSALSGRISFTRDFFHSVCATFLASMPVSFHQARSSPAR